jgi:hypothetical protein
MLGITTFTNNSTLISSYLHLVELDIRLISHDESRTADGLPFRWQA